MERNGPEVGIDVVEAGTDYPFEVGDLDPVTFVRSAGLAAGDEQAILTGNAERLFGRG
jgi:predicted TIM-barrel fold metal-dependent hydrolase